MSQGLIIFTRYPEPGVTKTRLIPALGAEGAAALHRHLTECTLNSVKALQAQSNLSVEICFTGGTEQLMQDWLGKSYVYRHQSQGDLGNRLITAFAQAFNQGLKKVIIIGTDCPQLDPRLLQQAFSALAESDLVLGPAKDGGYYLIGLQRPLRELFLEISWGSDRVFQQTVAIAQSLNLKLSYLPQLADIDRPEDLELIKNGESRRGERQKLITNDQ